MARSFQHEFIYGRQPVHELLRAGRRDMAGLFVLENARASPDLDAIVQEASRQGVPVMTCNRRRLSSLAGEGTNHQGVVIEVGGYPYARFEDILETASGGAGDTDPLPLVLLLDRVQDPQNLGSLMRSAEACGVVGLVLPQDRAVHVTTAAVRASAGASEHLSVCVVKNLVRAIQKLQESHIRVIGLEGDARAEPLAGIIVDGPTALVVGSEGRGLRPGVLRACDTLAALPMYGRINSLNAAIAGAVALFTVRGRQNVQ